MKEITNAGGCPSGKTKTAKIEVIIEPKIKEKFMMKLREEGKKLQQKLVSGLEII